MKNKEIDILIANEGHFKFIQEILDTIADAAAKRGTGIAKRSYEYIEKKMKDGRSIIAIYENKFVGFCYIETWQGKEFVANSGLIVKEEMRGEGLAKKIKNKAFQLSRELFPNSKIFGLTTGLAVMKINSELGYKPVTFSELTEDELFWKGCQSCVNYDILQRTERKHCLCTGMLFIPKNKSNKKFNILMPWQKK